MNRVTILLAPVAFLFVICLPVAAWDYTEPITQICATEGKIVRIPAEGGPVVQGSEAETFDGTTVVSLVHGPDRALALVMKRVVDIVLAAIGLVLGAPLLIAVADARRSSRLRAASSGRR